MLFNFWFKKKQRPVIEPLQELAPVTGAHRHFLRSIFDMPVRLSIGRQLREVRLLDISLKGALVDAPGFYGQVGGRGRLRLTLAPTVLISMDVVVARTQGHHLGLRCVHIDLDSLTHLRKLMERNTDDPLRLGSELARLIG
jgi:hypothetical protein